MEWVLLLGFLERKEDMIYDDEMREEATTTSK
jgi:hypothetical protein